MMIPKQGKVMFYYMVDGQQFLQVDSCVTQNTLVFSCFFGVIAYLTKNKTTR